MKFEIVRDLSFCLLQEEFTPCYAKISGATVLYMPTYATCLQVLKTVILILRIATNE